MSLLPGTDVWYRSYALRCDARFSYRISPHDPADRGDAGPDPLNPRHYASRNGDSSVVELPCAPAQPALLRRESTPRGALVDESFRSASGEAHSLQIYLPPGYEGLSTPCNLVLSIGGGFTDDYPVPTILDNLIAEGLVPPTIVVAILFDDMASWVRANRSDESFARYVAVDLLSWLRTRYRIGAGPRSVTVAGASAGGAGALFVAMRHPRIVGNVVSQSGGYSFSVETPPDELMPASFPESELLARELATTPTLPLRIFLAVGSMEDVAWLGGENPRYATATVLIAARHLRDVLEAKGYPLRYREYAGLHESLSWGGNLAEALVYVNRPTD
jgi:enterochelin esterase family protein